MRYPKTITLEVSELNMAIRDYVGRYLSTDDDSIPHMEMMSKPIFEVETKAPNQGWTKCTVTFGCAPEGYDDDK